MEPSISSFVLLFFVHACISWEEKYDLVDCHTICYFDALLTFFSAFFYSEKSKRGKAQTEAIISKMHFSPPPTFACLLCLFASFQPSIPFQRLLLPCAIYPRQKNFFQLQTISTLHFQSKTLHGRIFIFLTYFFHLYLTSRY